MMTNNTRRFLSVVLAGCLCLCCLPAASGAGSGDTTRDVAAFGDVDGDGSVTAQDARYTLRFAISLDVCTASQKNAADADGDGEITAQDARTILRKAIGLPEASAVEYLSAQDTDFRAFESMLCKLKSLPESYDCRYSSEEDVFYMLFDYSGEITELYGEEAVLTRLDDVRDPLNRFDVYWADRSIGKKYYMYYTYSAEKVKKLAADYLGYENDFSYMARDEDYLYEGKYYFGFPSMLGGLAPYPSIASVTAANKLSDGRYRLTCSVFLQDDYSDESGFVSYNFTAGLHNIDGKRTWTIYAF
ncbi:MAG: dockerin type I repeat-containing protein [Clostridia bacterium]|nr:dockerin type I repeat-containing protein [Clostridia bacterium]